VLELACSAVLGLQFGVVIGVNPYEREDWWFFSIADHRRIAATLVVLPGLHHQALIEQAPRTCWACGEPAAVSWGVATACFPGPDQDQEPVCATCTAQGPRTIRHRVLGRIHHELELDRDWLRRRIWEATDAGGALLPHDGDAWVLRGLGPIDRDLRAVTGPIRVIEGPLDPLVRRLRRAENAFEG